LPAEQEKTLKVWQAERDAAEKEAQTEVQCKEAARRSRRKRRSKVAQANRTKQQIEAEAAAGGG
jgi:hypothetical protein